MTRRITLTPPTDEAQAEQLLRELVEIPSLSGHEQPAAAYLVRAMCSLGLDAFVDEAGNAVGLAAHPDADGRCLDIVLLGHIDTVPGDIPVRREGNLLYGRGTVDAKGPLAAFVVAASRAAVPAGIRLVVVGATEEEAATSRGARHVLTQYRPTACIIGEPSGCEGVTLGYKGRLLASYTQERPMTHTAASASSAADDLCLWWSRVRAEAERHVESAKAFEQVQSTLRSMHCENDGLTERASAQAGFRLPPGVGPQEVEAICRRHAPAGARLEFSGCELAHVADRNNVVARALSGAIRHQGATPRPKLKTGTSDMNVVGPVWGCPIAAYGPGDSALDHTPNEHLCLAEYARSIEVLTAAIEAMAEEIIAPAAERP